MQTIPSPLPLDVKVSTNVSIQPADAYNHHSWELGSDDHEDGQERGRRYYNPYNDIGDSPRNEKLGADTAV